MLNAAGDLPFGRVATGLSEFVWNCKTVGGKLLFVQSHQSKHVSLNSFLSKRTIFSIAWFLGLVEDYSLWESRLVVGWVGKGRLGEGFKRERTQRALKVLPAMSVPST